MKSFWLLPAMLIAVTGCNDPSDDTPELYANCVTVLSDPEVTHEIARSSTTPDAACTCLEAHLADEADKEETITRFFARVAESMQATGKSAEETAGTLAAESVMPDGESDEPSFASMASVFEEEFETMLDEIEANEGACPAV